MCLGPLPEPKIDESNVTWFTFPPQDHDDISFDLEFKCSNVCRVVVKGMTWQLNFHHHNLNLSQKRSLVVMRS